MHLFRQALDAAGAATAAQVNGGIPNEQSNSLRPPKFSGHPHEDVNLWLNKFSRYADHAQLNDGRRLTCIKALLDGSAAGWLTSLAEGDEALGDYETFTGAMQDKFEMSGAHRFQMRQRLRDRRQRPHETVHAYGQDIAQMCQRLGVGEEEYLHTFVQGLLPDIKTHVLCMSPVTMEDANQAATAKESSIAAGTKVAVAMAPSPAVSAQSTDMLNVLKGLQETLSELKNPPNSRVSCQLCLAQDHVAPQCPSLMSPQCPQMSPQYSQTSPQYPQMSPQYPPRPPRRDRSQIQCYACGQWGHYKRECQSGKQYQNNEYRSGNDQGPSPQN